ncbi:epididymal-specific lipocalin-12 isoform 1-T1 [Glossophaga mutica]
MGPLSVLCVGLTLLGALKGHSWWLPRVGAQISKSFQKDQFQGTWFVLGLAGSTHSKADRSLLSPFTATFKQSGKHHLEVSFAMTRGPRCLTWSYLLTPTARPGQFSVDSSRGGSLAAGASSGSTCCAECGRSRSRRWTGSSACSEPRASRRTTSSFQTRQNGHPIRERAEGWSGPSQTLSLPSTWPQRGSRSPTHCDLGGCGSFSWAWPGPPEQQRTLLPGEDRRRRSHGDRWACAAPPGRLRRVK